MGCLQKKSVYFCSFPCSLCGCVTSSIFFIILLSFFPQSFCVVVVVIECFLASIFLFYSYAQKWLVDLRLCVCVCSCVWIGSIYAHRVTKHTHARTLSQHMNRFPGNPARSTTVSERKGRRFVSRPNLLPPHFLSGWACPATRFVQYQNIACKCIAAAEKLVKALF